MKSKMMNLSNYFVQSTSLGNDLGDVIGKANDGIFGIEIMKSEDVVSKWLITPPFLRIRKGTMHRIAILDEFTFYEGYLSDPFFLPLHSGLNGECMADIEAMELARDERVCLQWLFRKKTFDKLKTLDMYESYLQGNGYPIASAFGRSVQNKVLNVLNKLSNMNTEKEYSDEVEDKIAADGYQFQLRVAIRSSNPNEIRDRINDILMQYNGQNSLKLLRMKDKHITAQFENCSMTKDSRNQILSVQEINSLFGSYVSSSPAIMPEAPVAKVETGNIVRLLPMHIREKITVSPTLTSDLAGALKRVGLISTARLNNEAVKAGVRLTAVQCDIPKGKNLSNLIKAQPDIQAALGVNSLGIEQGTEPDTVRFTIPNMESTMICLRELIEAEEFKQYCVDNPLAFVVGVDEINNPIYLSLTKLVHLLIAGTTGSGKSVFLNSIVLTLIMNYGPDELQFLMVDPKLVELQHYVGFPHVQDVITDMDTAYEELGKVVNEMEDRYRRFNEVGVKSINLYNKKVDKVDRMPYLVCVIDEYADLYDQHKEVANHIKRLGQKARAAGIHLIIATQRPDAKVIEGRIKANIPNMISFNLNNSTDYKTVFGRAIPCTLLGRGDGIMKIEGYPKTFQRFQSPIISPDETKEEAIYKSIIDYYGGVVEEVEEVVAHQPEAEEPEENSVPEIDDNEDHLYKLKQIIATTRETKVEPLRKELGVQTVKMKELMTKLVEEGWLIKHKDKVRGYEIIIPDALLDEWKIN